ncbi:indole-3-glycerol phosphate synthase TrpC [Mesohalobacter halotolerans]|uniref:indole-3-glycerol-phosphate synthase n=1 Tax=Mesohalobacter halotolerans TaxID=1883405 RepID=A0A4U5TNS7_9FLAO|nr:indole-3-glycerol phosphate synthase TrpC [Mesohalobacter halotolerans]MBS3739300.1 indole-3-glycerol phosphate synthase TrpC [Psychroflexus sp.]TKS55523.1 indole-3-glycerol phosphate synthase TrpC [Mesohalobacter halotolerans]
MHILDEISAFKKRLLDHKKQAVSIKDLEAMPNFKRHCFALTERLKNSDFGIIAEHKRRSPSKPHLNFKTDVFDVAKTYEVAGVSGMSVLTEQKYFGGSLEDLLLCRSACNLPLLRKDFMVDEYQIIESKAYGADVILLIAACLNPAEVQQFSSLAKQLGMQSILEVHNLEELQQFFCESIDIVGVNNRNLKTFEVDLQISKALIEHIPENVVKISESGLKHPQDILDLSQIGYDGFLLGEHFMTTDNPGLAAQKFIQTLKQN